MSARFFFPVNKPAVYLCSKKIMKNLVFILTFLSFPNILSAQIFELNNQGVLANELNDSRSANWIDFNGDGHLDIYITNGKNGGQSNRLYSGDGLGNWNPVENVLITNDNLPSVGATWADVNDDGLPDCYTTNWYGFRNLMYNSIGSGLFNPIVQVHPVLQNSYSETASFGDYNNDGRLDLYVTNSAGDLKNLLFTQLSSGLYDQVTIGPAVTDSFASRCVNWVDYDNDGDLDLFVTNENNQKNNLYRNDSNGVFTPITTGDLVNDQLSSMSSTWGDYDNDGDLDVFISNWGNQNNTLYRNEGNDIFVKVNDTLSNDGGYSFCANWADIDNDSDLDLFVGNAFDGNHPLASFLYLNNGDGTFTRDNQDTVTRVLGWNYGNAFGDYDKDGDLDLLTANCLNEAEANRVFENKSRNSANPNNYVTIACEGAQFNRLAIGAKVRIKANIYGNDIWQMREISAQSGYCGQNMLPVHFGLGDAQIIDSIIIEWPSGVIDTNTAISPNNYYDAIEGQGLVLTPQSISLESAKDEIKVYPNPAAHRLTIEMECLNCMVDYSFINTLGQNVRCGTEWTDSNSKIDLIIPEEISPGQYTLKVETKDGAYTKKILIK